MGGKVEKRGVTVLAFTVVVISDQNKKVINKTTVDKSAIHSLS